MPVNRAAVGPAIVTYPGLWGYGAIEGFPLTAFVRSPFGPREPFETPTGWTSDFHSGIDLPAAAGTPVLSPVDGTVTAVGPALTGYGIVVFVQDIEGRTHLFAHTQEGLHPAVGTVVRRGDVLGQVGSTGASTGPHLHYSVTQPGLPAVTAVNVWLDRSVFVDPMELFKADIDAVSAIVPPFDFNAFVSNSLRALAANPPEDMNAALIELAHRVEYIRGLGF